MTLRITETIFPEPGFIPEVRELVPERLETIHKLREEDLRDPQKVNDFLARLVDQGEKVTAFLESFAFWQQTVSEALTQYRLYVQRLQEWTLVVHEALSFGPVPGCPLPITWHVEREVASTPASGGVWTVALDCSPRALMVNAAAELEL
ncbi:MAG: hypothetical protein KDD47_26750, partial [Acidobacteria bacterium]|nr:hypothetical protein [Acidobacteriota bacterium]